jgi:hypothetical protein
MLIAVRALVVTVLAGLLVWGATGCGTETVGVEELAQAADASGATDGVKLSIDATIDGPQGDVDMTGSGEMDMKGQRAQLEYAFQNQSMRQVMDHFTMYMQSPQFDAALEDGKKWAKIDMQRASKEFGIDLGSVQQPGSGDPRQMFSQLKAMAGDIEKAGTEKVRGVETTHYEGTVDVDKIPDTLPADRRAAARKTLERTKEISGLDDYDMDVWIDDDDLVRRMRMKMDMKVLQQEISFDFTMEFYEYGTRVTIDLPPEDEVQDLTDLAARGASALGGAGGP